MKTSSRLLALILACGFAFIARAADEADLALMKGMWKPTQAELAGQAIPAAILKTISLAIDGKNYEVIVQTDKGPSPDKGTLALETTITPKGMTINGIQGPNAGKIFPAIYELQGDTLRICYDLSGTKTPLDFKTTPGTKLYTVTYQRVK